MLTAVRSGRSAEVTPSRCQGRRCTRRRTHTTSRTQNGSGKRGLAQENLNKLGQRVPVTAKQINNYWDLTYPIGNVKLGVRPIWVLPAFYTHHERTQFGPFGALERRPVTAPRPTLAHYFHRAHCRLVSPNSHDAIAITVINNGGVEPRRPLDRCKTARLA